jgi:hypothetical protein
VLTLYANQFFAPSCRVSTRARFFRVVRWCDEAQLEWPHQFIVYTADVLSLSLQQTNGHKSAAAVASSKINIHMAWNKSYAPADDAALCLILHGNSEIMTTNIAIRACTHLQTKHFLRWTGWGKAAGNFDLNKFLDWGILDKCFHQRSKLGENIKPKN